MLRVAAEGLLLLVQDSLLTSMKFEHIQGGAGCGTYMQRRSKFRFAAPSASRPHSFPRDHALMRSPPQVDVASQCRPAACCRFIIAAGGAEQRCRRLLRGSPPDPSCTRMASRTMLGRRGIAKGKGPRVVKGTAPPRGVTHMLCRRSRRRCNGQKAVRAGHKGQ